MKKGSQHITKAPVIIARVLAAFRSRLASRLSFFSFLDGKSLSTEAGQDGVSLLRVPVVKTFITVIPFH